ncbi:hypothetical protein GUJ93_ZPchr0009g1821 [Zizania palustris]|uniref:Uncharacterized protein n=1 Tax=Zizania palustris TaxID=103762 RepID=A0A8J5RL67_ZIZPA|nr:hypothetical protein GUJ93_ZPchr0009g1821 [Zizania palustris]
MGPDIQDGSHDVTKRKSLAYYLEKTDVGLGAAAGRSCGPGSECRAVPTDARTMSSSEEESSPPSTPTTTSCPTPRPVVVGAPRMSPSMLQATRSGNERWLVKALLTDQAAHDLKVVATAGGNTLLHVVASGGHSALASILLHHAPGLLAARNAALDTSLHLTARAGAYKVVLLAALCWPPS